MAIEVGSLVAGEVEDGTDEVDEGNGCVAVDPGWGAYGPADDERNASGGLVKGALPPHAVGAEHLTMVSHVGDEGVVGEAIVFERIEYHADALVAEGDEAIVCSAGALNLLVGVPTSGEVLAETLALRMLGVEMVWRNVGEVGVVGPVAVEVGLADDEREVGGDKGGTESPRPLVACWISEIGDGLGCDAIVVALIRGITCSGFFDTVAHRWSAFVDSLKPVRSAADVGGVVNIFDESRSEAVVLIGADEVHFAGEGSVVTEGVETMGPGGLITR